MANQGPDKPSGEREAREPDERHSVLSELPRTRPQRPSWRREDARTQATTVSKPAPSDARKPPASDGRKAAPSKARKPVASNGRKPAASNGRKASSRSSKAAGPEIAAPAPKTAAQSNRRASETAHRAPKASSPTPRQGYEADDEPAGTSVAPPTGAELVGALAELAGELAQAGFSAGGRLLKGALSRLSGS